MSAQPTPSPASDKISNENEEALILQGFSLFHFRVCPRLGKIYSADSEPTHLQPQTMKVLLELARQPGVVLSRDEIFRRAWPNTHVSDAALARCISDLRRAVGDNPRSPEYIETIPKQGYRLLAPVRPLEESSAYPEIGLPFEAPENGAGEAGAGDRPTDGNSAKPRVLRNPRTVSRLALAALSFLSVGLLPPGAGMITHDESQPPGVAAYGHYLQGLEHYRRGGYPENEAAIAAFHRALEVAPDSALAHAGLARALVLKNSAFGDEGPSFDAARFHAEQALRQAPELPESHLAQGMALSLHGRHQLAALALQRALELRPGDTEAMGHLAGELQCLGRLDEALTWLARQADYGPISVESQFKFGLIYMRLGLLDLARSWFEATSKVDPYFSNSQVALAQLELKAEQYEAAMARLERLLQAQGDCARCLVTAGDAARELGHLQRAKIHYKTAFGITGISGAYITMRYAESLLSSPDAEYGQELLRQLEEELQLQREAGRDTPFTPVILAGVTGLLDNTDTALDHLDEAFGNGWLMDEHDLHMQAFRSLESDPRFQELSRSWAARLERLRLNAPRFRPAWQAELGEIALVGESEPPSRIAG